MDAQEIDQMARAQARERAALIRANGLIADDTPVEDWYLPEQRENGRCCLIVGPKHHGEVEQRYYELIAQAGVSTGSMATWTLEHGEQATLGLLDAIAEGRQYAVL